MRSADRATAPRVALRWIRAAAGLGGSGRLLFEADQTTEGHRAQHPVRGVDLELAEGEVQAAGRIVVVVLEEFATTDEIHRDEVARRIARPEVPVPIPVSAPVDDGTLYRSHQKVNRE